jgi:hypothetical protein
MRRVFSSSSVNIQVGDLPTSATISGTLTVCVGAPAPAITITIHKHMELMLPILMVNK